MAASRTSIFDKGESIFSFFFSLSLLSFLNFEALLNYDVNLVDFAQLTFLLRSMEQLVNPKNISVSETFDLISKLYLQGAAALPSDDTMPNAENTMAKAWFYYMSWRFDPSNLDTLQTYWALMQEGIAQSTRPCKIILELFIYYFFFHGF
jgi:hypothetical protein